MKMINRRLPNIVIPLNKESEEMLFRNIDDRKGIYYTLPISREDLSVLQEQCFFEKLNDMFNLNIDEFEEEYLDKETQKKVLKYLEFVYMSDNYICQFYKDKLILFIKLSLEMKRGLFIFL